MSSPTPSDPPTWPDVDQADLDESRGASFPDASERKTSPAGAPRAPTPRNGLGTAALVLGILGVVLAVSVLGGLVLGALALIFGVIGLRRARRGEASNRGQALAGTILGTVGAVLAVATVVVLLVTGVNPLVPRATTSGATGRAALQQCVAQAQGQRDRIRQCRQQFGGARRRSGTST